MGADASDDGGSFSGSAYAFQRVDGSTWMEVAKLTAADHSSDDVFGTSVATKSGWVFP